MSLGSAKNVSTNHVNTSAVSNFNVETGIVHDVIIDETSEFAKKQQNPASYIGAVVFRKINQVISNDLPVAFPYDTNFTNLPVKNEVVQIINNGNGTFSYRRISKGINPSESARENTISKTFSAQKDITTNTKNYQKVSSTGISRTNKDESKVNDGFGKYYKKVDNIHRLKLYEGDTLIESRFGQSIRLSGYNNPKNIFAPTLIIRNGESSLNAKNSTSITGVVEDINRDGSSLVMSSGQYELPFIPGTLDDKLSSDFQTKPDSFLDYPKKLIGDQLLLSSGRIILSARNAEMLFYSKKSYGFISDGGLSIDNKGGIDINVNDDINIITNGRNVNFVTGNGTIFLGNKNLEPMVKGQQLVDILSDLIDAIANLQFLTPSGPSNVGSVNVQDFGTIKSKLNNILSNAIQIS